MILIVLKDVNKKINFIYPEKTSSLSLTASECELNCPYCNKHYLQHMKTIQNIDISELKSILISGGVDSDGKLPFDEHSDFYLKLKNQNIKINLHSGIIKNPERLQKIKKYIDCISFDFIYDKKTIKNLYNGFYNQQDFLDSLHIIMESGIRVVPHIVCGIDYGKIKGEFDSIDYLNSKKISEIALLVVISNSKTEFCDVNPPEINEVRKIIDYSVKKIEKVVLGCMRPGGRYRFNLDREALLAGVKGIVMPHPEVVKFAKNNFYDINETYECCVF